MKKLFIIRILKILLPFTAIISCSVSADVYVDMSQTDEISIGNTLIFQHYTLKIDEPVYTELSKNNQYKNNSQLSRNLPFNNEVVSAANETAVEPALIHAVITVESKHNPYAQSRKGAYGLMQLMPDTSRRFKVLNKKDPKQNILAGAKYLRELLNLFNGDLELTLAAYNAGPAAVKKYSGSIPPYKETMDYVPKVLKYYRKYSYS